MAQVLKNSLAYLSSAGPHELRGQPGAGPVAAMTGPGTGQHIEILETRTVKDRLWLRISILATEPCSGDPTGLKTVSGWLPFLDNESLPRIWFYARGC